MDTEENIEHESFGLVHFARTTSSGGQTLFGSSIAHSNTVRLSISEAKIHRNLNYDWYSSKGALIEVEMSPSQFAEAITSLNVGEGVPCTIRWKRGEGYIKGRKLETKRAQFEREFERDVKNITDLTAKLTKEMNVILAKPNIVKADRERLRAIGTEIERETRSSLPFVASMFNEQMDKTVLEAKGEVEGFFQSIVQGLGVEHLKDKLESMLPEIQEPVKLTNGEE